jgi:hypothetical protein
MAKTHPKITLRPSRDIPLDKLVLSQANVRRIKNGVTIEHLADSMRIPRSSRAPFRFDRARHSELIARSLRWGAPDRWAISPVE